MRGEGEESRAEQSREEGKKGKEVIKGGCEGGRIEERVERSVHGWEGVREKRNGRNSEIREK